jgi:hypothetical protein
MALTKLKEKVREISRTERHTAERLLRELEAKIARLSETFYDIGDVLVQIFDGHHYRGLGDESFRTLLERTRVLSLSQAKKLMEVRRKFGRRQALRLGAEKAYALARYTAHTNAADSPEELIEAGFPIGGRRLPIDTVSVRAIQRATKTAVARHGDSASERERRDAERARRSAERTLRNRGVEGADVQVVRRRGRFVVVMLIPAPRVAAALGRTPR